jgi:1-deoxy-D-xylulose-5-phosphate synthase
MGTLLESIHSPADLKRLDYAQMASLAEEIRTFLIQTLSKTGGHLGPNLGVVELTLALHAVFSTPEDKILFDVSHQAYIHKILTGRLDRFETIRQPGGLNGFMLRTESEHDCYGAGHAGTALSAALGMAVARDLAGGHENVIAVAGDAAFTNGITFEALNNIAAQTRRMIVVLNDNEWSIDRNVGAVARYFHRIVTNEHYQHMHDRATRLIERFGGKTAIKVVRRAEEAAKSMLWPSILFEEFGLEYFGPLDGHNLPLLVETFKFLKSIDHPVLLHILTQKGRGFQPALDGQKKFHGLGPYDPETGKTPDGSATYAEVSPTHLPISPQKTRVSSPLPLQCPTAPASITSGRATPSAISTSASLRSTPSSLPQAWPRAAIAPSALSIPPFCNAPSIPSSTTCACRSCPSCFAWTAPASPAMTDPRITASSTSLICAAFPRLS